MTNWGTAQNDMMDRYPRMRETAPKTCKVCGAIPYSYAASPAPDVMVGDLFCHKHTLPENIPLAS